MSPSSDFRELVRSRTNIVDLIGESVTLIAERGGAEFKCLCPFHEDHNPSMRVYPDRQSFRCWVCNDGGDIFTWVMKRESLSFPEALEVLAHRIHLKVPQRSAQEAQQQARRADVFEVLEWAQNQFHEYLLGSPDAQEARDYIKSRGYTDETVKAWKLGYHPKDWDWLSRKANLRFPLELLVEARLIKLKEETNRYIDYFVDRVLWPIRDERSRVVAFGGRQIPGHDYGGMGKYLNSSESPVFQKSKILFGLPEAREAIGKEKSVLVVEGYADCVACHQHGIKNCIATLGTALTETHCQRLKAFAPRIVMCYDADGPGQDATAKAVGMLLGESVDLRVLSIPQGKDPDEFLKANSADVFRELMKEAPEAWDFRLNYEIKKHGRDSVNGRELILTEMLNLVTTIPKLEGTPREALILGRLAAKLRLTEADVRQQFQRVKQQKSGQPIRTARVAPEAVPQRVITFHKRPLSKNDKLDCELLEILLTRPDLATQTRREIGGDDVFNPDLRELLQVIFDLLELGEEPSFERITLQTEQNELKGLLVWLADQAREKSIENKLLEAVDGVPKFFRQNLDHLKWRREEAAHQAALVRDALTANESPEDPLARLRKTSQFHQRRATRDNNESQ